MRPDLSIIIISWNTRELLRECLTSVFAEPSGLKLEVFVADNASSDGSAEMVREAFPQVCVIENKENLGFATANNRVLPLCHAGTILLLNSDTVVKGDAFRVMLQFLAEHPDVGAVGPKLLHPQTKLSVLGCGHQPTLRTLFNHYFFLARLLPHISIFEGVHFYVGKHDHEPRAVGWISGASLMLRLEVYKQIGGLNERWFMYGEDVEWCARMLAREWKIYQVPAAVVDHFGGASLAQNASASLLPLVASRELFIQTQQPSRWQLFAFDLIHVCGLAMRSVGYLVRSGLAPAHERALWRAKSKTYYGFARTAGGWK